MEAHSNEDRPLTRFNELDNSPNYYQNVNPFKINDNSLGKTQGLLDLAEPQRQLTEGERDSNIDRSIGGHSIQRLKTSITKKEKSVESVVASNTNSNNNRDEIIGAETGS